MSVIGYRYFHADSVKFNIVEGDIEDSYETEITIGEGSFG